MRYTPYFLFILVALFSACSSETYTITGNGIIATIEPSQESGPKRVRIEVITEDIIRVSASPEARFPKRESLVVLPREARDIAFTVEQEDESVLISTEKLRAILSLQTGELLFTDPDGHILLREKEGGGKIFNAIGVDDSQGYSFRQVFESPADEAFFGLGQHQSDEWNYKGKNEILYQYNTKVSVPFIVSNRHYGLLWDNYSLTRFGDPRPYENLNSFTLYDKEGSEGGLTATYTSADGESSVQRNEDKLDYENLETVENFPEGFPFWESNIRWEGAIEAEETGTYEFKLYYAGYTSVHMNGEEVVAERWRTAWNPNTYKFRMHLEAGEKVPLTVEWRPDGGISYLGLKALGPLDPEEQAKLSFWSEMGQELDYYFIYGESMDGIIGGYRELTGKAPIMPQWAYGFWQSRERYKTQEEIVETLAEFRRRHIPIDNIVQDWSYWEEDQWGSHEFDPERFPDPAGMMDDIHGMNAHIMISVWPKFYQNTEHYRELDNRGWMYRQAVDDSIRDWIAQGYIGSFYDAYAPGAQKLFWEQMNEHLYSLGIDAWWMDASEPDILSNASLDYRKKLSGPTAIGSSTEFLNTYSLVNAEAIYRGQREVDPNKRVFLLTRSGFAGLQRYSTATWSGDIGTRWEDMKAQISAGLNFAMSGIPYWTMDIGGFCVEHRYEDAAEGSADLEEWRELNTRWYQFGTFVPLYRSHGQYPYREVFNLAPESHPAYRSIIKYNRMRYRLMPYIYSLAAKVYFDDYTLMRPLVMDFPSDPEVVNISDQYLFGPCIMVNPVYRYRARERSVYFPGEKGWYNLQTGKYIQGGKWQEVDAPYEQIPLYVRSGAILPVGPAIEFVGEKPADPIHLFVFRGADGAFTLYEDEGLNYNYEKGDYATIDIRYQDATKTLILEKRQGTFEGMIETRIFHISLIDGENPGMLDFDSRPEHSFQYDGSKAEIQL